jgi:RsiW-degrading membrane proteinase PrsW (M82 family)
MVKKFFLLSVLVSVFGVAMIVASTLRTGWLEEVLKAIGAALVAVGLVELRPRANCDQEILLGFRTSC